MLTIKENNAQYNIPDDVDDFVKDFFETAWDIVVDDAYNDIITNLLIDLFTKKLPADGEISEEEINDMIHTMHYGDLTEKNHALGLDAQYWIHDYVMYGLYLGNPDKFKFSRNYDSARGVRMTGDNSGYSIVLNHNNQGVTDPIDFRITSVSADLIHVQGGIPGKNYVNKDMDANSAIQLLLEY